MANGTLGVVPFDRFVRDPVFETVFVMLAFGELVVFVKLVLGLVKLLLGFVKLDLGPPVMLPFCLFVVACLVKLVFGVCGFVKLDFCDVLLLLLMLLFVRLVFDFKLCWEPLVFRLVADPLVFNLT